MNTLKIKYSICIIKEKKLFLGHISPFSRDVDLYPCSQSRLEQTTALLLRSALELELEQWGGAIIELNSEFLNTCYDYWSKHTTNSVPRTAVLTNPHNPSHPVPGPGEPVSPPPGQTAEKRRK